MYTNITHHGSPLTWGMAIGGALLLGASLITLTVTGALSSSSFNSLPHLSLVNTIANYTAWTSGVVTTAILAVIWGRSNIELKKNKVIYFIALAILSGTALTAVGAHLVPHCTTSAPMIDKSSSVVEYATMAAIGEAGVGVSIGGALGLYLLINKLRSKKDVEQANFEADTQENEENNEENSKKNE
jgi:hypothetical protein